MVSQVEKTGFAAWLTKTRVNRGLPQSELAEAIGRSQEYVSMLERGIRSPSHETAMLIGVELAPFGAPADVRRRLGNEAVRAAFPTEGSELEAELYLDEIRDAGYSELPQGAREVILEHIRLRREEERRRRGGE